MPVTYFALIETGIESGRRNGQIRIAGRLLLLIVAYGQNGERRGHVANRYLHFVVDAFLV